MKKKLLAGLNISTPSSLSIQKKFELYISECLGYLENINKSMMANNAYLDMYQDFFAESRSNLKKFCQLHPVTAQKYSSKIDKIDQKFINTYIFHFKNPDIQTLSNEFDSGIKDPFKINLEIEGQQYELHYYHKGEFISRELLELMFDLNESTYGKLGIGKTKDRFISDVTTDSKEIKGEYNNVWLLIDGSDNVVGFTLLNSPRNVYGQQVAKINTRVLCSTDGISKKKIIREYTKKLIEYYNQRNIDLWIEGRMGAATSRLMMELHKDVGFQTPWIMEIKELLNVFQRKYEDVVLNDGVVFSQRRLFFDNNVHSFFNLIYRCPKSLCNKDGLNLPDQL